jgi:hypothetical protein
MDSVTFIEEMIKNIDTVRNEEFKKHNYTYEDKVIEKKLVNETPMEFKKYQINMKKKALMEKMKPGNINKKEYAINYDNIDILEDNIFNNDINENEVEDIKLDIGLLERDKKLELIKDYIDRKNIILEEGDLKKIEDIVDNTDITLKKYINISKVYKHITKISFIKKLENGGYIIDMNENKSKKTKNYFIK